MDVRSYYDNVARAIAFYETVGYRWVDTPWVVGKEAEFVTFPDSRSACDGGYLVGSAEQGFIQLMLDGKLPPGKYVSAGPCFRFPDGDRNSQHHHPYFFKVELIHVDSCDYVTMMDDARKFMGGKLVKTNEGLDLELNGLEIGSYGYREYGTMNWSYGTGLAEPRYTEAKALCSYSTL